MKAKRFSLRNVVFYVTAVAMATFIAVALTPSPYADAATKLMDTNEETGFYTSSTDAAGTKTMAITVTATGKVVKFVEYATGNDFDVVNGTDYWSYRVVNGLVTAQYRIGSTQGQIYGRQGNTLGTYEFYGNNNVLLERHYVALGSWTRESYANGQVSESISRILTVNGANSQYGSIITTTIKDYVAPSPTPTAPAPTPTTTPEVSNSNFSSLQHNTKIEKKAYTKLSSLENLAEAYGWKTERTYTRTSSTSKKVATNVFYKGDFGGDKYVTFRFTQVVKKSGKKYLVSYYQNSKKVSASGVKKVIRRLIR